MSATLQHSYRFATPAQWRAGLLIGFDCEALDAYAGVRPYAPYGSPGQLFATPGAFAPAAAPNGEALWRDDNGCLHRLPGEDEKPITSVAPATIGRAQRIVATRRYLWVASPNSLQCFDREQLSRRLVVETGEARVLDLAGDGQDGVWVLTETARGPRCLHVDCAGERCESFMLDGIAAPVQLTYLGKLKRLVVLPADGTELVWLTPDGSMQFRVAIGGIRPCFTVTDLGSDGRSHVVVAGLDHGAFGAGASVIVVDGDGNPLGRVDLAEPATGVNATRHELLVATANGLLRFPTAGSRPTGTITCIFLTPPLQSPLSVQSRRWLRIEALATLPAGTTLEFSYAASDDPQVRDQAQRIAHDSSLSNAQRLDRLRTLLGDWTPLAFHGDAKVSAKADVSIAAPLFDVRKLYLWISVTLIATPGAELPVLRELNVLYPGRTLMEHLPALYQRAEAEPGNFLRALVGVIESTTQALDRRIAAMGSLIHPQTAPVEWLDYVARWLGLPWDDSLDEAQKRRLLGRAHEIAAKRGTRSGLEALLECLIPGSPRRYRLTDFTADYGFATVGGTNCRGSRLPAMLGGLSSSGLVLSRKAILGQGRLPCQGDSDDGVSPLTGQIQIDVMATANEQRAWEPWLNDLLAAVIPATTRVRLRWLGVAACLHHDRLDDALALEPAPAPHLGTDAVIGLARLPAGRGLELPAEGLDLGRRLQ